MTWKNWRDLASFLINNASACTSFPCGGHIFIQNERWKNIRNSKYSWNHVSTVLELTLWWSMTCWGSPRQKLFFLRDGQLARRRGHMRPTCRLVYAVCCMLCVVSGLGAVCFVLCVHVCAWCVVCSLYTCTSLSQSFSIVSKVSKIFRFDIRFDIWFDNEFRYIKNFDTIYNTRLQSSSMTCQSGRFHDLMPSLLPLLPKMRTAMGLDFFLSTVVKSAPVPYQSPITKIDQPRK